MDMQSKRGKALSVVTAATLAASLGVPVVAIAEEVDQAAAAQETAYQRGNVVDEMLAGQSEAATASAIKIGDVSYDTLQAAVSAIEKGTASGTEIKLEGNAAGNGVVVKSGTNFTLDLGGFTYTIDGNTVGSTGTETNGFQLLKDSNITIKNGVIKSDKARILIQNYSNLTLEGVSLEGGASTQYTLSNNNGETVIGKGTNVIAGKAAPQAAFDVCGFGNYAGARVTVAADAGRIEGAIELSSNKNEHDLKLTINGGDLSKATMVAESGAEKVEVAKADTVTVSAPQGFAWVDNALVVAKAAINGTVYSTLAEAVAAAADGATVTLLDNVDLDKTVEVSKNLKIDLASYDIKGNDVRAFLVKGGKLEFAGEGVVTSVKPEGGNLADTSSVIRVGDNSGDAGREASLVIDKDVVIEAPDTYGVGAFGDKTVESVEVYGKIHATSKASALGGNGSAQYGGTTFTLHEGSEVTATGSVAIYHPQAGTLTVEGALIRGLGGIELKGGEVDVKIGGNTKVEATGEISHEENNNGTSSSGYAVAVVDNKNYAGAAKVKIAAGEFVGDIAILTDNEVAEDKKGSIEITGGTFTKDPTAFVADGYKANESNGKWTVSAIVPPAPPAPQPDTDVEQRPDGSTVTTVTKPDGSQTVTTEAADGSQSVVSKDADGNVTSTEVSVSDKAAEAGEVVLPLDPSKPAADAGEAPAVEVKVPASVTAEAPVKVTVPVDADEPDYGVVVFAVDADGNETVLPKCGVDADGNAVFEATGDVTIKVVDAASEFPDVAGTWYGKQGVADFVSARGILTGVPQADGALRFEGDAATTRAMFVTMLHRAESCPDAEGAGFDDAAGLWFEEAAAWGEATGVVDGYGGSAFGGDDSVTREQMAVFLMRYAEHLGLDTSARADLSEFPDGSEASPWASRAMSWAVAEGLFSGRDGRLDPTDGATRAEASAVVMRFINGLYA